MENSRRAIARQRSRCEDSNPRTVFRGHHIRNLGSRTGTCLGSGRRLSGIRSRLAVAGPGAWKRVSWLRRERRGVTASLLYSSKAASALGVAHGACSHLSFDPMIGRSGPGLGFSGEMGSQLRFSVRSFRFAVRRNTDGWLLAGRGTVGKEEGQGASLVGQVDRKRWVARCVTVRVASDLHPTCERQATCAGFRATTGISADLGQSSATSIQIDLRFSGGGARLRTVVGRLSRG